MTDFQPMPKRFKVWDKETFTGQWCFGEAKAFSEVIKWFRRAGFDDQRYIIIQSTNLFDKDGKEIFEGSVVEFEGERHLVVFDNGCFMIDNPKLGVMYTGWNLDHLDLWGGGKLKVKIIGHILSNPELLEDENV